jgi:hypothetical protein
MLLNLPEVLNLPLPLLSRLLALPSNITLGWKAPAKDILKLNKNSKSWMDVKSFITLGPGWKCLFAANTLAYLDQLGAAQKVKHNWNSPL